MIKVNTTCIEKLQKAGSGKEVARATGPGLICSWNFNAFSSMTGCPYPV